MTYFPSAWTTEGREINDGDDDKTDFEPLLKLELAVVVEKFR